MARSIKFLLLSLFLLAGALHSITSAQLYTLEKSIRMPPWTAATQQLGSSPQRYIHSSDCAEMGVAIPSSEGVSTIKEKMRLVALKRFDQFLEMITSSKLKMFYLEEPKELFIMENHMPELIDFSEHHGYFSLHPIIAHVSQDPSDISRILQVLNEVSQSKENSAFVAFAITELIAKGLAYCDLKEGQSVLLPVQKNAFFHLEVYTVDRVFNLWNGMPAFGLTPQTEGLPSFLLFRGTDLTPYSKRGWASLLSDVDMAGPGRSVFLHARSEIHDWLLQMNTAKKRANAIGFSLGGCLAAYAFLYEGDLLNETGSIAFNPPGISEAVLEEWNNLSESKRSGFIVYVNRGDIISKSGHLFGSAYEMSTECAMKPLFAHTVLLCGQPWFTMAKIDIAQEIISKKQR